MPSVSAAKRTIPPPTSPIPNFDSDSASARTETGLTSTRTIDARHRRRHAYLNPPTEHIPVKVRQTRQYTQTNQPPAPPQVRLSLPKTDLPAIPQDSALSPRQAALPGQGTVQAPSMPAQRNSASLPSPSVARGAGAHHDRLIPCGRLSRGPIPSPKCATFRSGPAAGGRALSEHHAQYSCSAGQDVSWLRCDRTPLVDEMETSCASSR
ncbi:hypothetical protein V494_07811 [Pseudogymnoascus sp. VKM F-4513 (FW-928)]|nr:hypothetical protein V494_07811 [Pseudogymnoascus sp. VKM F-4513 (FW-928)]